MPRFPPSSETGRLGSMRRIALGFGIVLAALLAGAFIYRIELATALLRHGLSRAGLPQARFRIERLDSSEASIVEVEATEAVRIDRIDIAFDLRRVPRMPIERVRVAGARVDLAALPRRAQAREDSAPTGGISLGLLPVLELEGALVTVPSPIGPLRLRLDSRVTPEEGALRMRLDGSAESDGATAALRAEARRSEAGAISIGAEVRSLRVRHPRLRIADGSVTLRLEGDSSGFDLGSAAGEVALSLAGVVAGETEVGAIIAALPVALGRANGGDGQWTARLSKARVRLPGQALDAEAISGEVSAATVDLRVERLADTRREERRFEPLSLRLRVLETEPELRFAVDVAAARGRAELHATGRFDPVKGRLAVDARLPRLELDPKRVRLQDVSRSLAAAGLVAGAVEGTARVRWEGASGVSGKATLVLDGASVEASDVRIDGLSGTIDLGRLRPLETAGVQTLRAREIRSGAVFSDALLRWALEPSAKPAGSRLRISRFETGFAGGQVVIDEAVLDPSNRVNELAFRFVGMDVARLFELVNVADVSGTGTLSGMIPVAIRDGAVAISRGELSAGAGVLQIRSRAAADLLAGGGKPVELLLDALRNFHYDHLTMTVEKSFEGDATARLRLEGRNPDVLEGHPFRINLNLTGNLDRLVGALLEVARLSDRAIRATVRAGDAR